MVQKRMTPAEWQVMRVVWAYPDSRSSEIIRLLERDFSWKPTTIKTLLNRLKERKLLSMEKVSGTYRYHALLSEQEHLLDQWRQLEGNVCPTKKGELLFSILDQTELTQADWVRLGALAEEKREQAKEKLVCTCSKGQCLCGHHCEQEEL